MVSLDRTTCCSSTSTAQLLSPPSSPSHFSYNILLLTHLLHFPSSFLPFLLLPVLYHYFLGCICYLPSRLKAAPVSSLPSLKASYLPPPILLLQLLLLFLQPPAIPTPPPTRLAAQGAAPPPEHSCCWSHPSHFSSSSSSSPEYPSSSVVSPLLPDSLPPPFTDSSVTAEPRGAVVS